MMEEMFSTPWGTFTAYPDVGRIIARLVAIAAPLEASPLDPAMTALTDNADVTITRVETRGSVPVVRPIPPKHLPGIDPMDPVDMGIDMHVSALDEIRALLEPIVEPVAAELLAVAKAWLEKKIAKLGEEVLR